MGVVCRNGKFDSFLYVCVFLTRQPWSGLNCLFGVNCPTNVGRKKDRHSGHSLQMIQSTQTQTPVKYCNSAETKSIVRACLFFKDLAKQGDTESVGWVWGVLLWIGSTSLLCLFETVHETTDIKTVDFCWIRMLSTKMLTVDCWFLTADCRRRCTTYYRQLSVECNSCVQIFECRLLTVDCCLWNVIAACRLLSLDCWLLSVTCRLLCADFWV